MGRIIKEEMLLYRVMLIIIPIKEQVLDLVDQDLHKERLLEELEVPSHRDWEFNTYKIIMLRRLFLIKPPVMVLRKHHHMKLHYLNMPFRNGERSFGKLELVDSKKFGNFWETHVKKIMRPLQLWFLQQI